MTSSLLVLAIAALYGPKIQLILNGTFVEGCSCANSCAFESTGAATGCQNAGVYQIDNGSYGGRDISGVKIVWAAAQNDKLFIYIDLPRPSQTDGAKALAFALFSEGFGKPQEVKPAKIKLDGSAGKYHLTVNGGQTLEMKTTPVTGGDGKSFVKLHNVFGDPYDSLNQAKAVRASFQEGDIKFNFKETSAFFIKLKINKKI